jgi:hypothetical protein
MNSSNNWFEYYNAFSIIFHFSYLPKDNKARAIAMYLARDLSGISCKDMGAFFDGISGAAITMKYNQMNAELMRNKKLSDKIANLKKQLINI